jgi:iron complex outermembrane recepter protein
MTKISVLLQHNCIYVIRIILTMLLCLGTLLPSYSQCTGVVVVVIPDGAIGDSVVIETASTKKSLAYQGQNSIHFSQLCYGRYVACFWQGGSIVSRQDALFAVRDTLSILLPKVTYTLPSIDVETGLPLSKQNILYVRENTALQSAPLAFQLERLPGMTTLQTGSRIAKPTYFGFTGQRLILIKNTMRLEGQQWGLDHGPEINPLYASRIEQLHGAEAIALAGDGVGGVIRLSPPIIEDSIHWSLHWRQSYRTNGHQFFNAVDFRYRPNRIKGIGLRLTGSDSRAGNMSNPSGFLSNTGFKEYAWDGSISWQRRNWELLLEHGIYLTTIGIFKGSHSGNLTDLQMRIEEGTLPQAEFTRTIERPYQNIYHEASQAKVIYKIKPGSAIQLTFGRQYDERKEYDSHVPLNDSLAALNTPALHLHLTDYQGQVQWTTQWSDEFRTALQFGYHHQTNTYNGRFYIPNYTRSFKHTSWLMQWKKSKHSISVCTRIDHLNQNVYRNINGHVEQMEKRYFQPSIGVTWSHDPRINQRLHVHFTTANRPPTINELYSNGLHHGLAIYEMGNDRMVQEYAHRLLGEYQITKGSFRITATGMLQYIQDYIYSNPQKTPILTIRGAFPVTKFEQSDAYFAGLHAQIDYLWRNSASIALTHQSLRTTLLKEKNTPAYTPSDQYRMIIRYPIVRKKTLRLFAEWNSLYINKQWRVSNAIDILPPPKSALVHGLRIHGEYAIRTSNVEFGAGIENIFNNSYRLYTDRMRYYHDALGRNIQVYLNIPLNFYKK